jgi:hypothetical protein
MNFVFARKAVEEFKKSIANISSGMSEELPNYGSHAKTRYIEMLTKAIAEVNARGSDIRHISGYYFSNFGPKPSIKIFQLKDNIAEFLSAAVHDFLSSWRRAVFAGWRGKKGDNLQSDVITSQLSNDVYETLFALPDRNLQFIRLLAKGRDWGLIALFLRKVMKMDKERIDTYRHLGDKLTQYMLDYGNGSLSFYYEFSRAKDSQVLRNIIKSASERMVKAGNPPLFSYQEFILAFEHPSDTFSTWKIGRDLIAIRMLEMLHQHRNSVNLEELPDEISSEEE